MTAAVKKDAPLWLPSFAMMVVGHEEVRNILVPSLTQSGIEPGTHFMRTVPPILKGLLERDAAYTTILARVVRGHEGVPPELLEKSLLWLVTVIAHGASPWLADEIVAGGRQIAIDYHVRPTEVKVSPRTIVREFGDVQVPAEVVGVYWAILDHGPIRGIIGGQSNVATLKGCKDRGLPPQFVDQFDRTAA